MRESYEKGDDRLAVPKDAQLMLGGFRRDAVVPSRPVQEEPTRQGQERR